MAVSARIELPLPIKLVGIRCQVTLPLRVAARIMLDAALPYRVTRRISLLLPIGDRIISRAGLPVPISRLQPVSRHIDVPLHLRRAVRTAVRLSIGNQIQRRATLPTPIANLQPVSGRCALSLPLRLSVRAPLPMPVNARLSTRANIPLPLLVAVRGRTPVSIPLSARQPTQNRLRLPLPIVHQAAQIGADDVYVMVGSYRVELASGTRISMDEGDPVWTANIVLADARQFGLFGRDAPVELHIGSQSWTLIVESRSLSRNGQTAASATIAAVSPAARYQAPRAEPVSKTWDQPALASTIVRELLPAISIDWQIIDWAIPPYRMAIADGMPLPNAQRIVQAAGGVLESLPDGSMIARPRYPVTPDDYDNVTPDIDLTEQDDLFDLREVAAPERIVNRLRIADNDAGQTVADRIEWTPDDDNDSTGLLQAFPSPWRDVTLIHSHPHIALSRIGQATHIIEDELIEFRDGRANSRYPIGYLLSVQWHGSNPGGLAWTAGSTALSAAGWGLATISYRTKSIDYNLTALERPESVQILCDAPEV